MTKMIPFQSFWQDFTIAVLGYGAAFTTVTLQNQLCAINQAANILAKAYIVKDHLPMGCIHLKETASGNVATERICNWRHKRATASFDELINAIKNIYSSRRKRD